MGKERDVRRFVLGENPLNSRFHEAWRPVGREVRNGDGPALSGRAAATVAGPQRDGLEARLPGRGLPADQTGGGVEGHARRGLGQGELQQIAVGVENRGLVLVPLARHAADGRSRSELQDGVRGPVAYGQDERLLGAAASTIGHTQADRVRAAYRGGIADDAGRGVEGHARRAAVQVILQRVAVRILGAGGVDVIRTGSDLHGGDRLKQGRPVG